MKRFFIFLTIIAVLASLKVATSRLGFNSLSAAPGSPKWVNQTHNGILELKWRDLIPTDFHPEDVLEKNNYSQLDDLDPRAQEILQEYFDEVNRAPTVKELSGRMVKIPGYVVPLESDGKVTSEFLLVPSFGACRHVPPPPANQIIHVRAVGKGTVAARKWYDVVWVVGKLTIERLENDLGNAGYTIDAERIEPYESQDDAK